MVFRYSKRARTFFTKYVPSRSFGGHVTWNSAVPDPDVWCCILLFLCTLGRCHPPFFLFHYPLLRWTLRNHLKTGPHPLIWVLVIFDFFAPWYRRRWVLRGIFCENFIKKKIQRKSWSKALFIRRHSFFFSYCIAGNFRQEFNFVAFVKAIFWLN